MVPTSRMDLSKYQSQMQVQLVELFAGANSCGDCFAQFGLLQEQSADTIENLLRSIEYNYNAHIILAIFIDGIIDYICTILYV